MDNRLSLQTSLETIMMDLHHDKEEVYFQPPASIQMSYPAIVYNLSKMKPEFANNKLYLNHKAYNITVIDKNPDSDIPDRILRLPLCSFSRFFIVDNLNHWSFLIYI